MGIWNNIACIYIYMCVSCQQCIGQIKGTILAGSFLLTHLRSMGSTKRHFLRPEGWSKMRSTSQGNRLARRLAYLSVTQDHITSKSLTEEFPDTTLNISIYTYVLGDLA